MDTDVLWLEAGRQYGFDDLVFWQSRGRAPFETVAGSIRTVVLGPHASAAFPTELQPFVAPGLTRRKQFDFSDVLTSALGRAWAAADPSLVFIENPHSRLVMDPNRAPPAQPLQNLREFWARLARQRAGEEGVSFAGVDAIRPITFSGEDVLLQPNGEAGWEALATALSRSHALGPQAYGAAIERVIDLVRSKGQGSALLVVSLHDTMNTKMRADGAIVVERPEADRLPAWVNLGNRGNERGEGEEVSLPAAYLRRLAAAWGQALGAAPGEISLNQPYKGAQETLYWGKALSGQPNSGAVQAEFRREALLGPEATACLQRPGADWPTGLGERLEGIALQLARAILQ
ncbi:N-formylglutamate amidohydrolase [Hydrogenophaga sp. 2FB]|uniref:N-formylglutamate amidohydrolase n=1 Tax=Hydrogenophaga sp. 2FB TaxID=2502187 RepID=UPI0010F7B5C3|nr:N-formylglutamate amidohydrolase [Hydrogenophaga sp. 2FB]